MQKFRNLLANIISAPIRNKVARHRVRGLIRFGLVRAIDVVMKNRSMRDAAPRHYLAICAIAKNEGRYFQEWIEWHKNLGAEKFYIYDNESDDDTRDVLKPHIDSGLVEYNFITGKKKQTAAYDDCLKRHRYDARWIAFIDIDEFIVPTGGKTITEFLKDFENYSAVEINWMCYGSGGKKKRTAGSVMERFHTHAKPECKLNRHIKSIVNPRCATNFISSHDVVRLKGKAVDTNGKTVHRHFYARAPLHDKFKINHYAVKSYEEFLEKRARGRGMSMDQRGLEYFEEFDRNEVKE
jgi:hypothetical protein